MPQGCIILLLRGKSRIPMTTTPTFDNLYTAGSDAAAHDGAPMGRCIDGTYRRLSGLVDQANYCSHPIRMRGRISTTDSAGATTTTYSTADEPDGVLLKACGNRRPTPCPSCAALYRSDARHLIRAGLVGANGEPVCPEGVDTAHLMVVTMAAESQVGVYYPVMSKNRPLKARWGTQVDVSPLDGS